MPKIISIYGLFDPRSPDMVMYVGKGGEKRALSHWKRFVSRGEAQNALQRRWFAQLLTDRVLPVWRFLEENVVDWQAAERKWIAYWREKNPGLCNVADGGNAYPQNAGIVGARIMHQLYPDIMKKVNSIVHKKGSDGKSILAKRRGQLGGSISGPKNARKMRLHLTFEILSKGGKKGGGTHNMSIKAKQRQRIGSQAAMRVTCHKRWHVSRGIKNQNCKLCQEAA